MFVDHNCFYWLLDGQTGSGKTFTMEGWVNCHVCVIQGEVYNVSMYYRCDGDHGVSPRAVGELLRIAHNSTDIEYSLTFSMLEIYNETIRDLLTSGGGGDNKLDVRQTPEGNVVPGLVESKVVHSLTMYYFTYDWL